MLYANLNKIERVSQHNHQWLEVSQHNHQWLEFQVLSVLMEVMINLHNSKFKTQSIMSIAFHDLTTICRD